MFSDFQAKLLDCEPPSILTLILLEDDTTDNSKYPNLMSVEARALHRFNAQDPGPSSCIGLRFSIALCSSSTTCLLLFVYMLTGWPPSLSVAHWDLLELNFARRVQDQLRRSHQTGEYAGVCSGITILHGGRVKHPLRSCSVCATSPVSFSQSPPLIPGEFAIA